MRSCTTFGWTPCRSIRVAWVRRASCSLTPSRPSLHAVADVPLGVAFLALLGLSIYVSWQVAVYCAKAWAYWTSRKLGDPLWGRNIWNIPQQHFTWWDVVRLCRDAHILKDSFAVSGTTARPLEPGFYDLDDAWALLDWAGRLCYGIGKYRESLLALIVAKELHLMHWKRMGTRLASDKRPDVKRCYDEHSDDLADWHDDRLQFVLNRPLFQGDDINVEQAAQEIHYALYSRNSEKYNQAVAAFREACQVTA